ncbi:MAG: polysaccharide deacetylase [Clostridiales bacterium]|jgi:peptidoglycan/xylan/chitin deacetylase (PgdA/CDA1 family)|nr:polysaccharide deacetylase [Clostridiales bacterium]
MHKRQIAAKSATSKRLFLAILITLSVAACIGGADILDAPAGNGGDGADTVAGADTGTAGKAGGGAGTASDTGGVAGNGSGGSVDGNGAGAAGSGGDGAASDILIPRPAYGREGWPDGGGDPEAQPGQAAQSGQADQPWQPGQTGRPGEAGAAGAGGQAGAAGAFGAGDQAEAAGADGASGAASAGGQTGAEGAAGKSAPSSDAGSPAREASPAQIGALLAADTLTARLVRGLLLYPNSPTGLLTAASAAGAAASPYSGINGALFSGVMSGMASGLSDAIASDAGMQGSIGAALSGNSKTVYFTVDDGPSLITRKFLDVFEARGVRATFFVIGKNAEKYPDALREIYAKGHYIANHSYTHKYDALYASQESLFGELERWDEAVSGALGFDYHTDIFRFPAGSSYPKAKKYREALLENGYVYYDWNCLNGDAEIADRSADSLYRYMVDTYRGRDEVVLLLHDFNSRQTTVDMLDRAIDFFKERHYEFRTLDQK